MGSTRLWSSCAIVLFLPIVAYAQADFTESLIDGTIVHGQGATVVDIDGDGDRDVVVALSFTDAVYLYVNGGNSSGGGNGTTWATVPIAANDSIVGMQVAVADFNNDGDLDVAAVGLFDRAVCNFCSPGKVIWYENPGNVLGAWTPHPIDTSVWGARAISAADLTGDGLPDLVVGAISVSGNGNGVYWYRNISNASSWSAITPIDSALQSVETVIVRDVDADGVNDVVAVGKLDNQIAWYENGRTIPSTTPPFTKHVIATPTTPYGLDFADLDADPALELVATSGDGTIAYDPPADPTTTWTGAAIDASFGTGENARPFAADFNSDGRVDVAVMAQGAQELRWYRREANLTWTPRSIVTSYVGFTGLAGGDVNGDGRVDVATTTYDNSSTDRISWWRNDIGGTPTPTPTPTGPPIGLDRTQLRFGVVKNGSAISSSTGAQTVSVTAGAWTASSNQPFVAVSPASGPGSATLTVQIAGATGLPASGGTQATITVTSPGAPNSPQTITVFVQVYPPGSTAPPFGSFDSPPNNATGVTGAVPVTGWALDDVGVNRVELWRDPVNGDPPPAPNGKIFIANATFVAGARPDVESLYATYPYAHRAAWGYMLLTNLLPNVNTAAPAGGVGTFTLYAYVYDEEGNVVLLSPHTITCDNTAATKPFGTIDTPGQGATVSGMLDNFGWALTPKPPSDAIIPTDGSTVQVFVDGVLQGTAQYDLPRSDIQTLFPGYNNTNGAIGYFQINTTLLANGVHTIFWIVTDNYGRADGLGSRYFTVLN